MADTDTEITPDEWADWFKRTPAPSKEPVFQGPPGIERPPPQAVIERPPAHDAPEPAPPQCWGPGTLPKPAAVEPDPAAPPDPSKLPPAQHPGAIVRNNATGDRYYSNGRQWIRIPEQTASTGGPGETGPQLTTTP